MQIYDISVLINASLPVWPNDPPVDICQAASIEQGDGYNLSRLNISAHTGTHIDAPLHFLSQGKNIGSISLERLIGPAQVVEIPDEVQKIDANILDDLNILPGIERILFKTKNSDLWGKGSDFKQTYTALDTSGAQKLLTMGVKLVGIDYLSISVYDDITKPHITLLSNEVVLLEGCDFSRVLAGVYQLICLPLKVDELEGAPVRAVLLEEALNMPKYSDYS